uniref:Putative secreted protein n=1 Tax=Anopheles darlingi TaxID=43151 RepID=A0A2M4D899_ANODA
MVATRRNRANTCALVVLLFVSFGAYPSNARVVTVSNVVVRLPYLQPFNNKTFTKFALDELDVLSCRNF